MVKSRNWLGTLLVAGLAVLLVHGASLANDFSGYQNYAVPTDQHYVVMPEITGGWFMAMDYFPDNGNGDTVGSYETAGRALVANHQYIYMQKNYGTGAGSGTWQPGDAHGAPGMGLPGGHANWVVVARVTPAVGSGHPSASMDPSFIHISPDGTKVALGLGYAQPMLVFPVSMLDPDDPPLLNSGTGGNTPANGVTLFPWGNSPTQGVQYYEAEWVPDPTESVAMSGGTLDPAAATNNTHLAINTDRGWDGGSQTGDGSQIEVLDTTSAANRPVVTIYNIGYAPKYSASADLAVDNYGNLITGQGYDYNNPDPTNPLSETGQIKIFAADDWRDGYNGNPASPEPIEYDHESNIIAEKVLSAAAMGVDKDNNLHVGGGDVVSGAIGETGFAALIHADALEDGLDDAGPLVESSYMYKELQPDINGDDSATFAVYNPWAEGITLMWNPGNFSGSPYGPYDAWSIGVQPIATTYYNGTQPDTDDDGIPDGSDNAYLTSNADQADTDGDGWADAVSGQQDAWAADTDKNGNVGTMDYYTVYSAWGSSEGDPNWDPAADINGDGEVGAADYYSVYGHWGETTHPEPYY